MISRRRMLQLTGGALLAASGGRVVPSVLASPAPPRLMIDAMGEIRDVYGVDLLGEIIGSGLDAIFVTLCDPKTFEGEAMDVAVEGILSYDRYIAAHPDLLSKGTETAAVDRAREEGKLAIFYLFQNSTQFGRDLDRVDLFYGLGVRSSQITYNFQNWAGTGCKERTNAGLTHFGLELVDRMNSVGMLIDLSHANMPTMADAVRASEVPVVVSHTGCMAVYDNERNTTDDNLRLLAERGGVVGLCQIRPFISPLREGAFEHYLDHIEHALDVAGGDHVAIGSDRDHRVIELSDDYLAELAAEEGANFDPADWPLFMDELNGPRRMEVVWDGLVRRGLGEATIEKVMGGNLRRVYAEVIG